MRVVWPLPTWAWPLLPAAALILVVWVHSQYGRTVPAVPAGRRRLLVALRSAALILLLLALAGPSLYQTSRRERPPEIVVVVDDSGSMALPDGGGGATRWRAALRLAAAVDSLARRRGGGVTVTLLRGNGLEPARELTPGTVGADADGAESPGAIGTDLDGLLREVAGRWSGRPLRAVALITDGHSSAGPPAAPTRAAAGAACPVLAIGVGDPVGPPDRLIEDLRYPDVAYQGDRIAVAADIGVRAGADDGAPITVRLRAGGRIVAEAVRPADPGDGVFELELTVPAQTPGLQVYDIEVAPLANERFRDNNRATLAVDVRRDRSRLLCLAGRPGWDARFLAQAAAAESRLRLDTVYRGRTGLVLADSQRAWASPRQAAGWRRWDGVALLGWGDLRHEVDWRSLGAAVEEGLGLLVLAAGASAGSAPSGKAPGEAAGADASEAPPSDLADLLPVAMAATGWRPGPWQLRPDPEGAAHPLLAGVTHGTPPGRGLDNGRFPPLARIMDAVPQAGAVTLLRGEGAAAARGVEPPVLVAGRRGQGHVTWFGAQRLWELAFWETPQAPATDGEHPGRRLLRNLLIWTASGGQESGLRLTGRRQVYQEGERMRLETQWTDLRGLPVTDRPVAVELRSAEEAAAQPRLFATEPTADRPGWAQAVLPPLPPGRYTARPVSPGSPPVEGPEVSFVVTPRSLEAGQTRQDRQALRALAARWGGSYVPGDAPDATAQLAAALARVPWTGDRQAAQRRRDPWRGWPLLIMATALLGAEWAIRRGSGML